MWIFKDIILVVGLVVMAILFVINTIGTAFDIQQIRHEIEYWGLSWFELSSLVLMVALGIVVVRLIFRLNKYEKAKPILSNRQELFTAIHNLQDTARETILRHDVMRNRREAGVDYPQELDDYNIAYMAYWKAEKQLETQMSIAGQSFKKPLVAFQNTIKAHVLSRELPNVPSYSQMLIKLGGVVQEIEADIDAISQ